MRMQAEPRRVLSIDLLPDIQRRILSGRVRVVVQAGKRFERLEVGDALWVREALRIPASGPGGHWLRVCYEIDGERRDIRWPRAIARPSSGRLPAIGMPMVASRLTLIVTSLRKARLHQISEDAAVAAGVDLERGGFSNPLRADQVFEDVTEAFGRMWDCMVAPSDIGRLCWAENPEVVEIGIAPIARNIGDLVRGVGHGGVR